MVIIIPFRMSSIPDALLPLELNTCECFKGRIYCVIRLIVAVYNFIRSRDAFKTNNKMAEKRQRAIIKSRIIIEPRKKQVIAAGLSKTYLR